MILESGMQGMVSGNMSKYNIEHEKNMVLKATNTKLGQHMTLSNMAFIKIDMWLYEAPLIPRSLIMHQVSI